MLTNTPVKSLLIPFVLDEKVCHAEEPLIYRPWGTRTLKLKIITHIDMPKLWVRPQHELPEEAALGIFKAYADDCQAFHLTWGGGHEIGPCVKTRDTLAAFETCAPIKAGDTSYLYFELTHAGAELPESASVTLRAFERLDKDGKSTEQDQARLTIKLQPPSELPPIDEIIRIVPGEQDNTWVVSAGNYLPVYDSRWWPTAEVAYEPSERPPLILRIENGKLLIDWNQPGNTIAVIEDYTDPSVLLLAETVAFELFAFDKWSVALRVRFFWVDKYHGGDFFLGRHEVPDAERFDMIIRRRDGRVLLAGTDLHWREVWARVLPNQILRATLGMPREVAIQLAMQKWSETWNEIWAHSLHRTEKTNVPNYVNNPVEPYVRRLAEREATVTIKAGGTEAHVPSLHNVEQRRPAAMTSNDVRLG